MLKIDKLTHRPGVAIAYHNHNHNNQSLEITAPTLFMVTWYLLLQVMTGYSHSAERRNEAQGDGVVISIDRMIKVSIESEPTGYGGHSLNFNSMTQCIALSEMDDKGKKQHAQRPCSASVS